MSLSKTIVPDQEAHRQMQQCDKGRCRVLWCGICESRPHKRHISGHAAETRNADSWRLRMGWSTNRDLPQILLQLLSPKSTPSLKWQSESEEKGDNVKTRGIKWKTRPDWQKVYWYWCQSNCTHNLPVTPFSWGRNTNFIVFEMVTCLLFPTARELHRTIIGKKLWLKQTISYAYTGLLITMQQWSHSQY